MSSFAIRRLFVTRINASRFCRFYIGTSFAQKVVLENTPLLGESITEGTIARWVKQVGDSVAPDDVIVVVETDKVTVDVKSNYHGKIIKHLVKDNVSVNLRSTIM
jgi:pyruvate carboxylase